MSDDNDSFPSLELTIAIIELPLNRIACKPVASNKLHCLIRFIKCKCQQFKQQGQRYRAENLQVM